MRSLHPGGPGYGTRKLTEIERLRYCDIMEAYRARGISRELRGSRAFQHGITLRVIAESEGRAT